VRNTPPDNLQGHKSEGEGFKEGWGARTQAYTGALLQTKGIGKNSQALNFLFFSFLFLLFLNSSEVILGDYKKHIFSMEKKKNPCSNSRILMNPSSA
jgi:hypothetical protein